MNLYEKRISAKSIVDAEYKSTKFDTKFDFEKQSHNWITLETTD